MVKKQKTDKTNNERKVKITQKGPYIISGSIPLSKQIIVTDAEGYSYEWREVEKYPLQKEYALCHCGNSKNKPFCDSSHLKLKFDCTETASREPYLSQADEIDGPDIDLTDAQELCSSARFSRVSI